MSGRCIYYTTSNPGWGQQVNHGLEPELKKQVVKKDNHKTEIFIINTLNSHHSSSSSSTKISSAEKTNYFLFLFLFFFKVLGLWVVEF